MRFDFECLPKLLNKQVEEPDVKALIESSPDVMDRFENAGFLEFKHRGVSVMFREATIEGRGSAQVEPPMLLNAFHLHREGHEEYSQYKGTLPGGVEFGDSVESVISKLGAPIATGGGGMSAVLKTPIPRWMRYNVDSAWLQFQFDDHMKVEMATLFTPKQSQT